MSGLQTFGLIALIVLAIVSTAVFAYGEYTCVSLIKDRRTVRPTAKYIKKIVICAIIFTISFELMLGSIYLERAFTPSWEAILKYIFGGLFFGASLSIGTYAFTLFYYCKNLENPFKRISYVSLMISIGVVFISFLYGADAFSGMIEGKFLLPNGINFQVGFVSPLSIDKPNIAFYAICILTGAVFVYALCDHYHYKKYGRHGIIDSTFLLAFPAGIIGARIAYVIGNWHEFKNREFWHVFAIWEGGLTILGGAIAGIIVGVLWYMHKNKGKSIFWAVDIIVPTILIAQAIGRWGNFFNCEVHGGQVPVEYWRWLPAFIVNNAQYSSTQGWASSGNIWAPLFFVEFLVNMIGYFVLAHVFGKKLSKITMPGDLAFGYIIWYGFTRVFMEPLRDPSFNMGTNGYWSWFWSLIFVAVGTLCIAINHIVRITKANKANKDYVNTVKFKNSCIGFNVTLAVAIALIVVGSVQMATNPNALTIALNNFNIGVICLVVGCSILLSATIPLTYIVIKKKSLKTNEEKI